MKINAVPNKNELAWACRQFEAHFIETVLKQARRSSPGDPLGKSAASRTFKEMLDTELANSIAQTESLGIAKMLMAQLDQK